MGYNCFSVFCFQKVSRNDFLFCHWKNFRPTLIYTFRKIYEKGFRLSEVFTCKPQTVCIRGIIYSAIYSKWPLETTVNPPNFYGKLLIRWIYFLNCITSYRIFQNHYPRWILNESRKTLQSLIHQVIETIILRTNKLVVSKQLWHFG